MRGGQSKVDEDASSVDEEPDKIEKKIRKTGEDDVG
jgi:hypothetical protein